MFPSSSPIDGASSFALHFSMASNRHNTFIRLLRRDHMLHIIRLTGDAGLSGPSLRAMALRLTKAGDTHSPPTQFDWRPIRISTQLLVLTALTPSHLGGITPETHTLALALGFRLTVTFNYCCCPQPPVVPAHGDHCRDNFRQHTYAAIKASAIHSQFIVELHILTAVHCR